LDYGLKGPASRLSGEQAGVDTMHVMCDDDAGRGPDIGTARAFHNFV
jgi:hypothetical protein